MKLKQVALILIIFLLFTNSTAFASDPFSLKNIEGTIKELSSAKYKGRLSGEDGNNMAADYIGNYFKEIGLKPAGDNNTFFQGFKMFAFNVYGPCYFKVYDDKGNLVKEYKYGIDFKEDSSGASFPGSFKGSIIVHNEAESHEKFKGKMLLFPENRVGESPDIYSGDSYIKTLGVAGIISVAPENAKFNKRGHIKDQYIPDTKLLKIRIAYNVYPEIRDFINKNYTFEIKSTLETKEVETKNVIGMIEGKNKKLPPVIISAHFDGQGYDADGTIYPSAMDNASGVAFIMECARIIKNSGTPKRNVIFIAYNGEEQGLVGSTYFASNPTVNIENGEVMNFDMIGTPLDLPVQIDYAAKGGKFAQKIVDSAKKYSIDAVAMEATNSDHKPFADKGMDALTFYYNDLTNYHMSTDTIDGIKVENIKDSFIILHTYLKSKGIKMDSPYEETDVSSPLDYIIAPVIVLLVAGIGIYILRARNLKLSKCIEDNKK